MNAVGEHTHPLALLVACCLLCQAALVSLALYVLQHPGTLAETRVLAKKLVRSILDDPDSVQQVCELVLLKAVGGAMLVYSITPLWSLGVRQLSVVSLQLLGAFFFFFLFETHALISHKLERRWCLVH